MINAKDLYVAELKGQYKALSEVRECFPQKGSKHKAAIYIEKRIAELLAELSKLGSL